ncbi:MAG: hypothetical protein LBB65_09135 [Burkholderiales bacterium]|jgi:hypothetical protein|nr:hypothetical protein [Burkholderiales bacterium]
MFFGMQQNLQAELEPGERLLWSGQPKQGIYFPQMDTVLFFVWLPFSLLGGIFSISFGTYFLITYAGELRASVFLVSILCILTGFYLLAGHFFWDSYRRSRTYYGVTDKREILLTQFCAAKSMGLQGINKISLAEHPDKTGDISFIEFSARSPRAIWAQAMAFPTNLSGIYPRFPWPTFENIEDARNVYNIVSEAQQQLLLQPRR